MQIELKLTIDQVNGIMTALGELPVKTGAGQLMAAITAQVVPQLPEQTEEAQSEGEEEKTIGS
jgi:hypothetical protein